MKKQNIISVAHGSRLASLPPGGDTSVRTSGDMSSRTAGDMSLSAGLDMSRAPRRDTSRTAESDGWRGCLWCQQRFLSLRRDALFCSRKHRQAAFRARRLLQLEATASRALRFAYADPPYPGLAKRFYGDEPTYAGEVDHPALVASLVASYDGWALSTSARALRGVLPLCPPEARVCAWVKPIGANVATRGIHNTWEPLIVVPGRKQQPGKRDWLAAQPARGGGNLIGRKPLAFCCWLFELLGILPGDEFDDLFPGSGIVGRAWRELCRGSGREAP